VQLQRSLRQQEAVADGSVGAVYLAADVMPMSPTELQRRQAGGPSKKSPRSAAYVAARAALTEADEALLQLHSADTAKPREFADADSTTG
jgi:hypothetical protein